MINEDNIQYEGLTKVEGTIGGTPVVGQAFVEIKAVGGFNNHNTNLRVIFMLIFLEKELSLQKYYLILLFKIIWQNTYCSLYYQ